MTWQKEGMLVIVERNFFLDCAIYCIRFLLIRDQCLQKEIYCGILYLRSGIHHFSSLSFVLRTMAGQWPKHPRHPRTVSIVFLVDLWPCDCHRYFFYSPRLSAWHCVEIVTRNWSLITLEIFIWRISLSWIMIRILESFLLDLVMFGIIYMYGLLSLQFDH